MINIYSIGNTFLKIQLIIETRIAPKKAVQNLSTVNPVITVPKYQKIALFIIRGNIPRVIMFNGKVKILTIGLTNILNKVKKAPTIKATQNGFTTIPGII
jgi:hypothetical protein